MARYRVINAYRDRDGVLRQPGDVLEMTQARGDRLVARRLLVPLAPAATVETATPAPVETAALRHVGGGWYELPDGARVRGRAAAERRMQEAR